MSSIRFSRLSLLAAVLICTTVAFSQKKVGAGADGVDKFIANLPGYTIFEGFAFQIDTAKMCCETKLPTALFFNKSAPYVAFSVRDVEYHLDQFRDLPLFQLRADEAIVVIGVTPPPAKYFNYTSYLMTRTYPPETTPKAIFASLGDSINVSTIKTLGPDPFNRPVVMIFTPDQGTDARMRAALHKAGYPDAMINTLPFPVPILQLGVDKPGEPPTSDVLLILNRMARFSDPKAGQAYLEALQNPDFSKRPLRVFRVTPPAGGAPKPFPAQPPRIRGTGQSEMNLAPDMARLRQAILDKHQATYNYTEYHTKFIAYDGYEYIERRKNVLGDNRDSLYFGTGYLPLWDLGNPEDMLTLGEKDFLVAYGPNHVATGKATYTNINVYASEQVMFSMVSAYDNNFEGSAGEYLGFNDPAASLMYVQKFAYPGQCLWSHCLPLEVPPGCKPWCPNQDPATCPTFILNSSTKLGLFMRNYLEPPTSIGPAVGELLYDQVIKFSPK